MRLDKFQLSGFKSFAKTTTLDFPHAITAIVGPNGSGKSNIAEGIRWALGEQSMKSLRGKRGEDLIFNGSPEVPRVGKASVKLFFDNKDGKIPLDFSEVIFERKVFRDGINEYYLNDSQVRLKDVVELLARMGLGETKHNIIGQGEIDKALLSSATERREMLEEAIGLKVYQIKKTETERKLEETSKNIAQAQALIKEIQPHLKFLRQQAEKAENRSVIEKELRQAVIAWIVMSRNAVEKELARLSGEHDPDEKKLAAIEKDVAETEKRIADSESTNGTQSTQPKQERLLALENKRRELERELGRIEGKMEMSTKPGTSSVERMVEIAYMRKHLSSFLDRLEEITAIDDLDEIRERVEALVTSIENLLAEIEERAFGKNPRESDKAHEDLGHIHKKVQDDIKKMHTEIEGLRDAIKNENRALFELQESLRKDERMLREKEEERGIIRSRMQRYIFEKERSNERLKEIESEERAYEISNKEIASTDISPLSSLSLEEIRKKIEKYRVKLEEVGGIDPAVVKEYQDTKTRYEFLDKEITDLEGASRDLKILIKELENTMERDFQTGFNKIKEEFNNYFRIIFGGGKGIIKYVAQRTTAEDSEDEEEKESVYGIEIDVDVPRKRIQSLSMLSGGEKALTSIALLFAITAVNPPPFLILDESDAALDEANSQKYATILRELSKKTQLILITHNRETMKQAGILYGVTMGNDGVSRLLSLKLEEAEVYTNR